MALYVKLYIPIETEKKCCYLLSVPDMILFILKDLIIQEELVIHR